MKSAYKSRIVPGSPELLVLAPVAGQPETNLHCLSLQHEIAGRRGGTQHPYVHRAHRLLVFSGTPKLVECQWRLVCLYSGTGFPEACPAVGTGQEVGQ